MNFDPDVPGNMPELRWPYAYWIFWGFCLAVAGGMLALFWRLGWLDGGRTSRLEDSWEAGARRP